MQQQQKHNFNCPICHGREYSPVFTEPRSIFSKPLFFQCAKCSMAFVDPKRFSEAAAPPMTDSPLHRSRWIEPS